jgi:hypothetical protein
MFPGVSCMVPTHRMRLGQTPWHGCLSSQDPREQLVGGSGPVADMYLPVIPHFWGQVYGGLLYEKVASNIGFSSNSFDIRFTLGSRRDLPSWLLFHHSAYQRVAGERVAESTRRFEPSGTYSIVYNIHSTSRLEKLTASLIHAETMTDDDGRPYGTAPPEKRAQDRGPFKSRKLLINTNTHPEDEGTLFGSSIPSSYPSAGGLRNTSVNPQASSSIESVKSRELPTNTATSSAANKTTINDSALADDKATTVPTPPVIAWDFVCNLYPQITVRWPERPTGRDILPLLDRPVVNPVIRNPSRKRTGASGRYSVSFQVDSKRTAGANLRAVLVQATGVVLSGKAACLKCQRSAGQWDRCVVDGSLNGSCANCFVNGEGSRCPFRRRELAQASLSSLPFCLVLTRLHSCAYLYYGNRTPCSVCAFW